MLYSVQIILILTLKNKIERVQSCLIYIYMRIKKQTKHNILTKNIDTLFLKVIRQILTKCIIYKLKNLFYLK